VQQVEGVVHEPAPAVEGALDRGEVVRAASDAEAEGESAPGELVETRGRLGEPDRRIGRRQQDVGDQADPGRRPGGGRQARQRVVRRIHQAVDRGQGAEPALLRPAGPLEHQPSGNAGNRVGESDTDLHVYLLRPRSLTGRRYGGSGVTSTRAGLVLPASVPAVDVAECRRLLGLARVARLATVDGEGRPHLVPVTFALSGDTVWSAVDRKPKRTAALKRVANVRATGRACLLADHYDEDWSALWWVRADADAAVLPPGSDEIPAAVAALVAKYDQYAVDPPPGPVIRLAVRHWTGWRAR
jgi:PPOX class probable F420-dependent enzyme